MTERLRKIKLVLAWIVYFAASKCASSIIKNNLIPVTTYQKVLITIGAVAIGSMVGDAAKLWAERTIDEYYEAGQAIAVLINNT